MWKKIEEKERSLHVTKQSFAKLSPVAGEYFLATLLRKNPPKISLSCPGQSTRKKDLKKPKILTAK